tara:strand:- start:760 stop:1764 length:1005 start_codon:yes stop_codon:yes gene_type:complete
MSFSPLLAPLAFLLALISNGTTLAADDQCALKQMLILQMEKLPSGRVTVPLVLNGHPKRFLLDLGGNLLSISSRVAEELAIKRKESGLVLYRAGKNAGRLDYVTINSVILGQSRLPDDMQFLVIPESSADDRDTEEANTHKYAAESASYDGVFRPGIFSQNADVDLDFGSNRLALFSNDHCEGQVVYWQASEIAVVPFNLTEENRIVIPVKLDGLTFQAMLDTGSWDTRLDQNAAKFDLNVDLNAPNLETVREVGFGKFIYQRKFSELSFEGVTIRNPLISLWPDFAPKEFLPGSHIKDSLWESPTMLIGMNVLTNLHVYIAFEERKLYITAAQ